MDYIRINANQAFANGITSESQAAINDILEKFSTENVKFESLISPDGNLIVMPVFQKSDADGATSVPGLEQPKLTSPDTTQALKTLAKEIDKMLGGFLTDAPQNNPEKNGSANESAFNLYALLVLLQKALQKQQETASQMKIASSKALQTSYESQANSIENLGQMQASSAQWQAIAGAVTLGVSIGTTMVSGYLMRSSYNDAHVKDANANFSAAKSNLTALEADIKANPTGKQEIVPPLNDTLDQISKGTFTVEEVKVKPEVPNADPKVANAKPEVAEVTQKEFTAKSEDKAKVGDVKTFAKDNARLMKGDAIVSKEGEIAGQKALLKTDKVKGNAGQYQEIEDNIAVGEKSLAKLKSDRIDSLMQLRQKMKDAGLEKTTQYKNLIKSGGSVMREGMDDKVQKLRQESEAAVRGWMNSGKMQFAEFLNKAVDMSSKAGQMTQGFYEAAHKTQETALESARKRSESAGEANRMNKDMSDEFYKALQGMHERLLQLQEMDAQSSKELANHLSA